LHPGSLWFTLELSKIMAVMRLICQELMPETG